MTKICSLEAALFGGKLNDISSVKEREDGMSEAKSSLEDET
jgi:hypothetical protein